MDQKKRNQQCCNYINYIWINPILWRKYFFCDILDMVTFQFCDILCNHSVLMTFLFWWHFSFGDFSVLVTFEFWWHFNFGWNFSFSNISVLETFQVLWHFSFVDIWFWLHFCFIDTLVLGTFQFRFKFYFWWYFSLGNISVLWHLIFGDI